MALITCDECSRDVSDRAAACPNCGAPVQVSTGENGDINSVTVDGNEFIATKDLIVRLAVRAIQSLNYKVDSIDESTGLVTFTTGMTWGSWSGVSGSIFLEKVGENRFTASGNAKQNLKGGQLIALDLGGEAKGKVNKVITEMRRLAAMSAHSA